MSSEAQDDCNLKTVDPNERLSAPSSGSARRRARERRQAQRTRVEGELLAAERREQRARDKSEQQRRARAELATYEPWGRAGGGAPHPRSLRRSDLRAGGIFPEDELRGVSLNEVRRRWSARRRRRRTPLRLREDPQVCFADNLRQTVDNDIRYRQTPDQHSSYRLILDDMVDKRKRAMKDEIQRNLEYERKMGWTDNEIFTQMHLEHKRYKRSLLTLPNVKKDDDSKQKTPDKENTKPNELKLPDIKQTNTSKSHKTDQEKHRDSNKENIKESNIDNAKEKQETNVNIKEHCVTKESNDVNGKDDDSSTVKGNNKVKKKIFVKRLSNGEAFRRVVPEEDSSGAHPQLTPEERILRTTGGVELVPILARRRRTGTRTLHSSDVTRPPDQFPQWREMLNDDYLRELKHQMTVKCQRKEETRLNSAESVRQHHETWASLWGRPGHGAPQRGRYARSNLAQLLYVEPLTNK